MLLLDSKTREIDGITIFPDHADPMQFFYMPLDPHLTTVKDAALGVEAPKFSLIRFRGAAGNGGFLNFDVNVGVPQERLDAIRSQLQREDRLTSLPRLGPVPLVGGTVRLMMLGSETPDPAIRPDDDATPAPVIDGPKFVLKIDHPTTPSLYGNNQASFSVRLDEAGVTTVLQALDGEILPIAVVYSLAYLGLRPAYAISLKIDWERVQKHFDESFKTGFLFVSAEIGKAVDDLVDDRAIEFTADTFIPEGDEVSGSVLDRRDAALAQVRAMMTEAFFTPSLPPYEPGKGDDWANTMSKARDIMALIGGGPAGAQAQNTTLFSYKSTDYKRTDKKTLNVNLSERTTVQRSIHPQGHLAGMFKMLRDGGLPLDRFVTDVNLDDPWFKRRRLEITAQTDFDTDLIASINVKATYDGQPKNVLLTKAKPAAAFEWASQIDRAGGGMKMPIDLQYTVAFSGVDRTERPSNLASSIMVDESEAKAIDPRDLYGIVTTPIIAVNFPWERFPMVEVHVRYTDAANKLDEGELFRLDKEHPEAVWRMFVLDLAKAGYEYKLIFRGADSKTIEGPWTSSEDEQITVVDPFPSKRVLQIVPAVHWSQIKSCFVDVRYQDKLNGVNEEQSFQFTEGGNVSETFQCDLEDPTVKTVFYKATFLYKDGRSVEAPESMTLDRRIVIREDMKGRRVVEVRPPKDFKIVKLRRATVELRYEDFTANLSFADNKVFEAGAEPTTFEYDYVDQARDNYEHRTTFLYENGLKKVAEWKSADAAVLQINVP